MNIDNKHHMTISRDRLEEFKRNSAGLSTSNSSGIQEPELVKYSIGSYHNNYANRFPIDTQSRHIHRDHFNNIHNETVSVLENHKKNQQKNTVTSTEFFFANVENIKQLVEKINGNITEIELLHMSVLSSTSMEKADKVSLILEDLVAQTSRLNKEALSRIKDIEANSTKSPLYASDLQMRQAQLSILKKKFIETIQRYQDIEHKFEKKQRQRIERQILIVKPRATPFEINETIDSDEAPQIFAHSLLSHNKAGKAFQVLNEVQSRHKDIKKIEKTILELHQLFFDIQNMIEFQQETLSKVEKRAEETSDHLEQGSKHVSVAVKSARATHKRKWFCLGVFIVLLIATAILIWWFCFPNSHSQYMVSL